VDVPDLRLGLRWADVPMNWTCPECGARKDDFEMTAI
jgi:rubredoxin